LVLVELEGQPVQELVVVMEETQPLVQLHPMVVVEAVVLLVAVM
jgi:hypothetical protein